MTLKSHGRKSTCPCLFTTFCRYDLNEKVTMTVVYTATETSIILENADPSSEKNHKKIPPCIYMLCKFNACISFIIIFLF